jgi:hypothetical protein
MYTLCDAHLKALSDPKLDVVGKNEGWSHFFNDGRKGRIYRCDDCHQNLIEQLQDYKGGLIDLEPINKCFKVVAEVVQERPIKYLMQILNKYDVEFRSKVYGKFGGFFEEKAKVLFFYESTENAVEKRLDELETLVKRGKFEGRISVAKGCDWMQKHVSMFGSRSGVKDHEKMLRVLLRD